MQETTLQGRPEGQETLLLCQELYPALQSKNPDWDKAHLCQRVYTHKSTKFTLQKLGHTFANPDHMLESLVHSSFIHEFPQFELNCNERLEFLGDAIISYYVAAKLFRGFPMLKEGELSRMRSALVNEAALAELADLIELPQIMLMGKGEIDRKSMFGHSIKSDAFEALIGAVWLDGGEEEVFKVIENVIREYEEKNKKSFFALEKLYDFDSKSQLQEKTMKLFKSLPEYVSKELDNGNFLVEVVICGKSLAAMEDNSKKKAEKALASKILKEKLLNNIGDNNVV